MVRYGSILLFLLMPLLAPAQPAGRPDSFTVYFFLLEDCKITQAYTDKIQALYREFAHDSIGFWGGFPSPVSGCLMRLPRPYPSSAFHSRTLLAFTSKATPTSVSGLPAARKRSGC